MRKSVVFVLVGGMLTALASCLPMTNTPTTVGTRPAGNPAAAAVPSAATTK